MSAKGWLSILGWVLSARTWLVELPAANRPDPVTEDDLAPLDFCVVGHRAEASRAAPPDPTPAPGVPPPSPRPALVAAGVDLPELTWLGSTSVGRALWAFPAAGDDLFPWWRRLRDAHESTGWWPVLLGPTADVWYFDALSGDHPEYDGEDALRAATEMDPTPRLTLPRDEWLERCEVPPLSPRDRPLLRVSAQGGYVGLVPVEASWQVPAVFGWSGAMNSDIDGDLHSAILRSWHERFGAELAALTSESELELVVDRPPTDPDVALAVAVEHTAYAGEWVGQDLDGDYRVVAARQVPSPSWYFWWD